MSDLTDNDLREIAHDHASTDAREAARAALAARRERDEALERIARLEGRLCLVCGAKSECGSDACTFDPSPIEAAQRFMRERDEALAEAERLRADLAAARERERQLRGLLDRLATELEYIHATDDGMPRELYVTDEGKDCIRSARALRAEEVKS